MPAKNHITLGFNYGTELPKPKDIMESSGKLYRHVKIKNIDDLNDPDLMALLKFSTTCRVPPL